MSLNRYEQTIFNYLQQQADELRHWQTKVRALADTVAEPGAVPRELERELWEYFRERSDHVSALRELQPGGVRRVSLLNLAEYMLRLWGPPPKRKNPRPDALS